MNSTSRGHGGPP
jgi:hypothetical protein